MKKGNWEFNSPCSEKSRPTVHEHLEENDRKKEIVQFHWNTASVCRQLWKACS